jgi:hypothetical protein
MRCAKVVLVLLLATSWVISVNAQVHGPASVAGFRLVAVPGDAINVPASLRRYVPKGNVLRAEFRTRLAPSGETIYLYDDGEEIFPRIYLGALRDGRNFKLLDGGITGIEGFLLVRLDKGKNGLAVAYHTGEDSADTEFVIFAASGDSYKRIFYEPTMEGQMQIVSSSPLAFRLWSAAPEFDPKDLDHSCVWCLHRFRIQTYAWDGRNFRLTNKILTKKFLRPVDPGPSTAFIAAQMSGEPAKKK